MKKLLPILFLAACGAPVDEDAAIDLSEEASTADKADSLASTSSYYTARRDTRRCVYPLCGGIWVKLANSTQTTCVDGRKAAECYVAETNFSASGLSGEGASEFANLFGGGGGVVRGKITRKTIGTFGTFGVLTSVSSGSDNGVWRGSSATASTAPFRVVHSSGIVCITTPCPSLHQAWLNVNSNYSYNYHSNLVELSVDGVPGISDADVDRAYELASSRLLVQAPAPVAVRGGYRLNATQVFLPYEYKAPSPCVVDGCSGTICRGADEEPVFTTCEFRAEYACYPRYGHCELQADGSCGWASNRDFLACLQNPPPLF